MNKACLICGALYQQQVQLKQLLSLAPLHFDCICPTCRLQFKRYDFTSHHCQVCGRELAMQDTCHNSYQQSYQTAEGLWTCYDCYRWLATYPINLVCNQPLYHYSSTVMEWLYQYKYRGDARLAKVVSQDVSQLYRHSPSANWCVLASSPQSLAERGFHATSHLLAQADIPHTILFDYVGDQQKQAKKTRTQRLQLRQPFSVKRDTFIALYQKNPRFLLFDDVYTTGATLLQAKLALSQLAQQFCETATFELKSMTLARDSLEVHS